MSKVDILIPYWGEYDLLVKAVNSVIAQSEKDWHLYIIDDCYPSLQAKETFSTHKDKRISYIRHKKNKGLVANYNYSIDLATAPYCVIMGCDDIMLPEYLNRAIKNIGYADYYQPNVGIINSYDTRYFPLADRIKGLLRPKKPGLYAGEKIVTSLCHGNWLYFPSIMWNVSTLKEYYFDVGHPNTQDLLTAINILRDGGSLFVDNELTFYYRRSDTSFSSKAISGTRFQEENEMYNTLAKELSEKGWNKASIASKLHITVRLYKLKSSFGK